mgnify:FL=1
MCASLVDSARSAGAREMAGRGRCRCEVTADICSFAGDFRRFFFFERAITHAGNAPEVISCRANFYDDIGFSI